MTTKANLVELWFATIQHLTRSPGSCVPNQRMKHRWPCNAINAFYFFFSAPIGAVYPGLLNESSINEVSTPCSYVNSCSVKPAIHIPIFQEIADGA